MSTSIEPHTTLVSTFIVVVDRNCSTLHDFYGMVDAPRNLYEKQRFSFAVIYLLNTSLRDDFLRIYKSIILYTCNLL